MNTQPPATEASDAAVAQAFREAITIPGLLIPDNVTQGILLRAREIDAAPAAPAAAVGGSAEEMFERYVQDGIAQSPEPLRELGRYLADHMDEDEFQHANALILQLATTPTPPAGGFVVDEDSDIVKCHECGAIMDLVRPGKYQHPECSQSISVTMVVDEDMTLKACNTYDAERKGESPAEYQAMFHALKSTAQPSAKDGVRGEVTFEDWWDAEMGAGYLNSTKSIAESAWDAGKATTASGLVDGEEMFYLQDTRQYVGNCALWWGPDGSGYTTRLDEAGKYTKERALRQAASRDTDVAWPCALIDKIARPTIDMQDLRREAALGREVGE